MKIVLTFVYSTKNPAFGVVLLAPLADSAELKRFNGGACSGSRTSIFILKLGLLW